MAAAILAGLKPHIDAAVRDQMATILLEVLGKIAPERLARARAAGTDTAPVVAADVPAKPEQAPIASAKSPQAGKRNGVE